MADTNKIIKAINDLGESNNNQKAELVMLLQTILEKVVALENVMKKSKKSSESNESNVSEPKTSKSKSSKKSAESNESNVSEPKTSKSKSSKKSDESSSKSKSSKKVSNDALDDLSSDPGSVRSHRSIKEESSDDEDNVPAAIPPKKKEGERDGKSFFIKEVCNGKHLDLITRKEDKGEVDKIKSNKRLKPDSISKKIGEYIWLNVLSDDQQLDFISKAKLAKKSSKTSVKSKMVEESDSE